MRKPAKTFAPPIPEMPPFAVVYGKHEIVLAYTETKAEAEDAVALLNAQAPQYNHRVKELSIDKQETVSRTVRRGNA